MASLDKVDLSLDEIIKLSKRRRGPGGTRGRGRGVGRGQRSGAALQPGKSQLNKRKMGRGQSRPSTVTNLRSNTQVRAQQLRQKARQTLFQSNRNLKTSTPAVSKLKSQQPTTSAKQRLGTVANTPRGRGRGTTPKARGRGTTPRGRGSATPRPQSLTPVRGGRIRVLRGLKAVPRGRRGRGGRYDMAAVRNQIKLAAEGSQQSPRGRGRGRGRGRSQPVGSVQVSFSSIELEPAGVELHPSFAADQHTSKSLNFRFTPATGKKQPQRFVQEGDRAVHFNRYMDTMKQD